MHQPRPLNAWTEVLETSIAAGGLQAARDFHPGDTIVDVIAVLNDYDETVPQAQPRQVAQHIPAGTELVIGDDGRVYGLGLPAPAEGATIAGIPIQTDDQLQPGRLELRNAEGRVLSSYRLETVASDVAVQDYLERLILQGGAIPWTHPDDAAPDAPKRFEAEDGVMGHQVDLEQTAADHDELAGALEGLFTQVGPWTERAIARAFGLPERPATGNRVRSIYVASSWRNPHQPHVVEEIRQATAAEVYDFRNPPGGTGFAWSSIDPDWKSWTAEQYLEALEHPLAEAGFDSDFAAMKAADTFVLVLPCGRSAHLELGWAVGQGKRTVLLTQDGEEPELMAKMVDKIATSVDDVIEWLVDQDAQAHHEEIATQERIARIFAEVDQVPIPFVPTESSAADAASWTASDPLQDLLADPGFLPERAFDTDLAAAADRLEVSRPFDPVTDQPIVDLVAGVAALEEVAVAAATDVDVAAVEQLRDAAAIIRSAEDGPEVIRHAIATGLEHAARTLEAGNPVDELDEVLEIAQALADSAAQACRVCGCTNSSACSPPCSWAAPDLCSAPACLDAAAKADQS